MVWTGGGGGDLLFIAQGQLMPHRSGQVHLLGHAERLRPAEGALQDLPADGMRLAQHHGPLLP
eukprot:COSAG01_NODE_5261_length_4376_cov_137.949497_3_plen_62_part_01